MEVSKINCDEAKWSWKQTTWGTNAPPLFLCKLGILRAHMRSLMQLFVHISIKIYSHNKNLLSFIFFSHFYKLQMNLFFRQQVNDNVHVLACKSIYQLRYSQYFYVYSSLYLEHWMKCFDFVCVIFFFLQRTSKES